MKQGFLRSSRYSPGNMDPASLEALFVGRDDVMDDVLSRVINSVQSPDKHYILLVGPRGSGKTHFLALAYHRLMNQVDAANIHDGVAIALLNEEEWGVASFLDLLVRILRALSDEAPNLGAAIDEIYERFSGDPADAEMFALAQLRQHTSGKTLLLLCENLVDLFAGLGEEGQKRWRATIQEDGNWAIVASTPSLFAGLTLQDNPFYGFFTIRVLEKIDLETGLQLLARKAVHEGKTELAGFLRTPLGRARARAIHHLAAGNHRAYVVLFDFLDKESLEDLVAPFMQMIDDLTPYYQDRMRQLAPAQRKIIKFLCNVGKPTTIKNISTPCLTSHQTAAKQIGELETAGLVSRMRHGRNTYCELSDPLMRICIEVKDNKTQHFRLFVELLRHWFTTRELESRHEAFRRDDLAAALDRAHVNAVFDAEPGRWHSHEETGDPLAPPDRLQDGETYESSLVEIAPAEPEALLTASGFHYSQGRLDQALDLVDKLLLISADNQQARYLRGLIFFEMQDYRRSSEELRQSASQHPNSVSAHGRLAESLLSSGDYEDAIKVAEHLIELDPVPSHAYYVRGRALIELGRSEDGVAALDELLPTDDCHTLLSAASLVRGIGDYKAARRYLERVDELEPSSRALWIERTRLEIDEGALDAAIESAAKLGTLPDGALMGRLLAAQARAATEPLPVALQTLGASVDLEEFESHKMLHREATAEILDASVSNFGPRYLLEGMANLRTLLADVLDNGVLGEMLTEFLIKNVDHGFAGSLEDWESAFDSLASSLADLRDCQIPIEMLQVAVKYAKTGDGKHLLSLPLEQRQLLEKIQPSVAR